MYKIYFLASLFLLGFTLSYTVEANEPTSTLSHFIDSSVLEKEVKAFCLNQSVTNSLASIRILESTERGSLEFNFESIRFEVKKIGANNHPNCSGIREIVLVKNKKGPSQNIYDSGFVREPYCEDPVRYSQPPIIYNLQSLEVSSSKTQFPLAIIETVSSTLPCPDVDDVRLRSFAIYDLTASPKSLIEVQGDFVVPEIGENPYRLHFINVTKVYKNSFNSDANQRPISLEISNGKLVLNSMPWNKNIDSNDKTPIPPPADLEIINALYSKNKKTVYIKTADRSGPIKNADPATFQLLSTTGDSAYTKDAKRVYFYGDPVVGADSASFVQLNDRYGKDLKNVYHMEEILEKVDIASFIAPFSNVWYAKDKDHVYNGKKIVIDADPDSFSVGDDRSCGKGCSYRSEDKQYRFDANDQVVQKILPAGK